MLGGVYWRQQLHQSSLKEERSSFTWRLVVEARRGFEGEEEIKGGGGGRRTEDVKG